MLKFRIEHALRRLLEGQNIAPNSRVVSEVAEEIADAILEAVDPRSAGDE